MLTSAVIRIAFMLTAGCAFAAASSAQIAETILQVEYVSVTIDHEGNETPYGEGTHYIGADGSHRHDHVVRGERITHYRLPGAGARVAVNHELGVAVGSRMEELPWDPTTRRRGAGPPPMPPLDSVVPPESLGGRAFGPLLLNGYVHDVGGIRTELWSYEHPMSVTNPRDYPPVVVEIIISTPDGRQFVSRATAARRIPASSDVFTVPYPVR